MGKPDASENPPDLYCNATEAPEPAFGLDQVAWDAFIRKLVKQAHELRNEMKGADERAQRASVKRNGRWSGKTYPASAPRRRSKVGAGEAQQA